MVNAKLSYMLNSRRISIYDRQMYSKTSKTNPELINILIKHCKTFMSTLYTPFVLERLISIKSLLNAK